MDSIRQLPGYRASHDTIPLLTVSRIDSLPMAERTAWRLRPGAEQLSLSARRPADAAIEFVPPAAGMRATIIAQTQEINGGRLDLVGSSVVPPEVKR
ncbi:MAG TPA: hypothetical protein VHE82_13460 [Gemmatimonadaceae bacterium]|nr:hypothetical protein [Gemmatimonadaceae bacterium]